METPPPENWDGATWQSGSDGHDGHSGIQSAFHLIGVYALCNVLP